MRLTWNITSDWNVQHMLRDKGNMRRGKSHGLSGGPFVRQAGWVGGGGWVEGLVDFRKNIYMYKTDIFLNHTLYYTENQVYCCPLYSVSCTCQLCLRWQSSVFNSCVCHKIWQSQYFTLKYSLTSPYGHLYNMDISLLRAVRLVSEMPKIIRSLSL